MSMLTNQVLIDEVLNEYEHRDSPVRVFDFGIGHTISPIAVGAPEMTYLTSTACYLYIKGKPHDEKSSKDFQNFAFPMQDGEIKTFGDGWSFIHVRIPHECTPESLRVKLAQAAQKLLGK